MKRFLINTIFLFGCCLCTICFIIACQQPHPYATTGSITRLDPRMNDIIPEDAILEILADGFDWSEGPVWIPNGEFLLFSDIPKNTVYRWDATSGLSVFTK